MLVSFQDLTSINFLYCLLLYILYSVYFLFLCDQGHWFSAIEGYTDYLLGNPIIWWTNLVVMAFFGLVYAAHSFKVHRGYKEIPEQRG